MSEEKTLPVVDRYEGGPVVDDAISVTRSARLHVCYRWKENGIDHILHLAINSPTIESDDISASLYMEKDDTGTVGTKIQTSQDKDEK